MPTINALMSITARSAVISATPDSSAVRLASLICCSVSLLRSRSLVLVGECHAAEAHLRCQRVVEAPGLRVVDVAGAGGDHDVHLPDLVRRARVRRAGPGDALIGESHANARR